MVDAHVYRGHFPCGLFGCLAIPLDQQGDAHVFTLGLCDNGEPIILIECKHWEQDLNLYDNQLIRYFNVSKAKFGVLTNGIIYKFYTDLAEPNKMDEKPFLEVNLLEMKDAQVEELKKFHRSYFDVDNILISSSICLSFDARLCACC